MPLAYRMNCNLTYALWRASDNFEIGNIAVPRNDALDDNYASTRCSRSFVGKLGSMRFTSTGALTSPQRSRPASVPLFDRRPSTRRQREQSSGVTGVLESGELDCAGPARFLATHLTTSPPVHRPSALGARGSQGACRPEATIRGGNAGSKTGLNRVPTRPGDPYISGKEFPQPRPHRFSEYRSPDSPTGSARSARCQPASTPCSIPRSSTSCRAL